MTRTLVVTGCLAIAGCQVAVKPITVEGTLFQPQAVTTNAITADMTRALSPISTLGIEKIGVLAQEVPTLVIAHFDVTFSPIVEKAPLPNCITHGRLTNHFISKIGEKTGHTAIELSGEAAAINQYVVYNRWNGTWNIVDDELGDEFRQRLMREYDIEALLVIREATEVGYYLGSQPALGGKGITTNRKRDIFAFSSYEVHLINLRTGKQIRRGSYRQGSLWEMTGDFNWDLSLSEQPREMVEDLCYRVRVLDENNVSRTLWRFRIDPAENPPTVRSMR